MKKVLFLALLAGVFVFAACDDNKNDDKEKYYTLAIDKIYILDEEDEEELLRVTDLKAIVSLSGESVADMDFEPRYDMELKLPATVPDSRLKYITDAFDDSEVSNTSAKWTAEVILYAYEGVWHVGYLSELSSTNTSFTYVRYIYVNKDVDINAEWTNNGNDWVMNLSLKKGWNRVGQRISGSPEKYTYEYRNSVPSSVKWCYIPKTTDTRGEDCPSGYPFPVGFPGR